MCNVRIEPDASNNCVCTNCPALAATMRDDECPRCSSTIGPYTADEAGCPRCRNHRFQFERAIRLGRYDGKLRDAILHLKTNVDEVLGESLGQCLAQKLSERIDLSSIDSVIPMPLHWRRRLGRGYNQTEPIARGVAHTLKKPLQLSWLKRRRSTSRQRDHSATERWNNVRDAFQATSVSIIRGATILLIDDVLTTGATASSAANELRKNGAKQVVIAVLAHES